MFPTDFKYYAAKSVDEAISLLQEHGDDAKLLAGGHSLLPVMKLRLYQPAVLIDINKIDGLRGVSVNGNVKIGAMTTYHALESSEELQTACPVLCEVAGLIGDAQVRNRGTIGGSLAHADPAADLPAVMLALDGTVTLQGPEGIREVSSDDLFVDMLTTSLEPNELITEVTVPKLGKGEGAAYTKLRQPASRYAIVGAAAYVKLGADGKIESARVAITGAGPKATRQSAAEAALVGAADDAAIAAACDKAGEDMDFLGDIHASEDYRRAMVKVYAKRAVAEAMAKAQG